MIIYPGDRVTCVDNNDVTEFLTLKRIYDVAAVDNFQGQEVIQVYDDKQNKHFFKEERFTFHSEYYY